MLGFRGKISALIILRSGEILLVFLFLFLGPRGSCGNNLITFILDKVALIIKSFDLYVADLFTQQIDNKITSKIITFYLKMFFIGVLGIEWTL